MFSFLYVHTSTFGKNTEIRIYRRKRLKFIHLIILIDKPNCATLWWHLYKLYTSCEDFKPPPDLHILPFTFQPTRALPTQIHLHVTTLSTVFDKFVFSSVNSLYAITTNIVANWLHWGRSYTGWFGYSCSIDLLLFSIPLFIILLSSYPRDKESKLQQSREDSSWGLWGVNLESIVILRLVLIGWQWRANNANGG